MIFIDRKNMREILNFKDRVFRNFLVDVKKCELLYEFNNKFYINLKYFIKGIFNFENKEYIRIYINISRFFFEYCILR